MMILGLWDFYSNFVCQKSLSSCLIKQRDTMKWFISNLCGWCKQHIIIYIIVCHIDKWWKLYENIISFQENINRLCLLMTTIWNKCSTNIPYQSFIEALLQKFCTHQSSWFPWRIFRFMCAVCILSLISSFSFVVPPNNYHRYLQMG